jgi:hypothetical protein
MSILNDEDSKAVSEAIQAGTQADLAYIHANTGLSFNALISMYSQLSQAMSKQQFALIRRRTPSISAELSNEYAQSIVLLALQRGFSPSAVVRALFESGSLRSALPLGGSASSAGDAFQHFLTPAFEAHDPDAEQVSDDALSLAYDTALMRRRRVLCRQLWAAAAVVDAFSPHAARVRRAVGRAYEYVLS